MRDSITLNTKNATSGSKTLCFLRCQSRGRGGRLHHKKHNRALGVFAFLATTGPRPSTYGMCVATGYNKWYGRAMARFSPEQAAGELLARFARAHGIDTADVRAGLNLPLLLEFLSIEQRDVPAIVHDGREFVGELDP